MKPWMVAETEAARAKSETVVYIVYGLCNDAKQAMNQRRKVLQAPEREESERSADGISRLAKRQILRIKKERV